MSKTNIGGFAAIFAALLALGAATPAAAQASFSCTGNLDPTETVICGDASLSALDRQLATAYQQKVDSLASDQRAGMVAAQQAWLTQRDGCGTNSFCIKNAYLVRIAQLSTASAPSASTPVSSPPASTSANDAACTILFKNRCPDLANQPNFVGLCYNRNPQVFSNIPANCNSTFQQMINQTIPAQPAATQANSTKLPYPGMSLGGQVRSGPGTNYAKVTDLAQGTPVTILADTGLTMDGYHWFQIAWSAGKGYEWGGIMCSDNVKLNGIFQVCASQ